MTYDVPALDVSGVPPVRFSADFASPTGYANDARMLAYALIQAGVDVTLDAIPMDRGSADYGPVAEVLRPHFGRELDTPIQIMDTVPNFWPTYRKKSAYAIARLAWETDTTPADWTRLAERTCIDEVWAPSSFNTSVLSDGLSLPSFVVPMAHDLDFMDQHGEGLDLREQGIADDVFVFLSVGTWIKRKNFEGLLAAYCAEFGPDEPVHLVLKINSGRVDAAGRAAVEAEVAEILISLGADRRLPPITILQQHLPTAEMIGLYRRAQCGVFPTHGEGWGLPISEMMACGTSSIVTGWGGVLEFCTEETAHLLPYQPTPVRGMQPMPWYDVRHSWAEPDLTALRARMREVAESRDAWQKVGWQAKRHVQERFGMRAVAQRMIYRLRAIAAEHL